MSDKCAFEGVWIPADLWLSKDLSLQEKVMLVEIKSLSADPERGCYKSNKAFGEFFGLSAGRISQIIKSLEDKALIRISYQKEGKRVIERNIFIYLKNDRTLAPEPIKNSKGGYLENDDHPIKDSKGGYLENAEESNTSKSNTYENNNIGSDLEVDPIEAEFEQLWQTYPKRAGGNSKAEALKAYRRQRKTHPFEEIHSGLLRYRKYCELTGKTGSEYVKQMKTFLGPGQHWRDEYFLSAANQAQGGHNPGQPPPTNQRTRDTSVGDMLHDVGW